MPAREVVVVTGSSGFIGAPFIRALANDRTVVGFDRAGDPHPPMEAECVCVDLTGDGSVEAGLARVRYAYGDRLASVVHLAAYYDFSGAPSSKYEAVTVQGTRRLLGALQGFDVEQFVFSSTMLVHRPARVGQRIDESWALGPTWPYPASKMRTEQLIAERRGVIPVVLLRMAGMIERTSDHYALDTTRARELLGWQAQRSLRNTIPVIATALKDDPASWHRANGLTPPRRGGR